MEVYKKIYQNNSCLKRGSLTVEASLAMPFFIFMVIALCYIFIFLKTTVNIQMDMYNTAYSYSLTGKKVGGLVCGLKNRTVVEWDEKNGMVYAKATDTVPFLSLLFNTYSIYVPMSISDYSGDSMVSDDDSEEYVYITSNPQVYHVDPECTYLKPNIKKITVFDLPSARNESGAKYYPCESCMKGKEVNNCMNFYVTPYGTRYHVPKECKKIYHNVRKVKLKSVGNLRPCSKCGN